jgi:hypothetical protein
VEILDKKIDDKLTSEDLVKSFQNLFTAIDSILERVGRRVVAAAQGRQASIENESFQALCTKMMSLFESQFVGGDEDRPAKLLEFLDQVESRVISSNNQNSENISNHLTESSQKIDSLTSLVKK